MPGLKDKSMNSATIDRLIINSPYTSGGSYQGTDSLPFDLDAHWRVAVKIVDDRGVESLKVVEVE